MQEIMIMASATSRQSAASRMKESRILRAHTDVCSGYANYEYVRNGTYCIFLAFEPLAGKRMICVKKRRVKADHADFMKPEKLADHTSSAETNSIWRRTVTASSWISAGTSANTASSTRSSQEP
jgi:hypothetical protein